METANCAYQTLLPFEYVYYEPPLPKFVFDNLIMVWANNFFFVRAEGKILIFVEKNKRRKPGWLLGMKVHQYDFMYPNEGFVFTKDELESDIARSNRLAYQKLQKE